MLYKISSVVTKTVDWKIVNGMGADGSPLIEASVNRTNKRGEVFPNFDAITEGAGVEGEPWTSEAGKLYLFAPRVNKPKGTGRGNFDVAAAQVRKAESIKVAQDNTSYSVKTASTARDATLLLVALLAKHDKPVLDEEWQLKWVMIRSWLWDNFEIPKDEAPPF